MSQSLKDQYVAVQKRAFLKWTNIQLRRARMSIDSIETGFKDGVALCALCEVISGEKIGKRGWAHKPKNNIQMLENLATALKFLNSKVKLVGIGNRSIFDGNVTLILGLLWTIILRFQVAEIEIAGVSGKKGLILWAKKNTKHRKPEVNIKNLHSSWKDGLGFCALIEKFRPDLMDYDSLDKSDAKACLQKAFDVAENELGIPSLLDPEDMMVPRPDEKTVTVYVSELFKYFSQFAKMDAMVNGIKEAVAVTIRHDEGIAKYNKVAGSVRGWIAEANDRFDAKESGSHLEDISKLLEKLQTYRKEEKPRAQAQMFSLDGILNTIHNSQRHNKRPLFEPQEELTVEALEKAFTSLVNKEAGYEKRLRDMYTLFRKYMFLLAMFKAKRAQVSQWVEDKAEGVENLDADFKTQKTFPTARAANKKMMDFLEDAMFEQKRFAPLIEELADLADKIEEPFHAAKVVKTEVTELKQTCEDVVKSLLEHKATAEGRAKQIDDLETQQDDLRKESSLLKFKVNSGLERLNEPVVEESVQAVEDHMAKLKAEIDQGKSQYTSDLASIKEDDQKLQDSGFAYETVMTVDDLEDAVSEYASKADARLKELADQLQMEKDRDACRQQFADAANALKKKLDDFSDELLSIGAKSAGDPDAGLSGVEGARAAYGDMTDDLANVAKLQSQQDDLDIVVNTLTNVSTDGLEAKYNELGKVMDKMVDDFNALKGAGKKGLSPQQQKDLKKIFDSTDKNKSGSIGPNEFHEVCTAMGIVLTDDEINEMFKRADKDGDGAIDFSEFMMLMEEQLLTSSSKEDVLNSFKTMSGGADKVPASTLKQHFGTFMGVFGFITSNMGDDGDYVAFTEKLFSR